LAYLKKEEAVSIYLAALTKYAVFGGRARRAECWVFILANAAMGFILSVLGLDILRTNDLRITLANLFGVAVVLPTFSVLVRRLHDTGRSGWWGIPALILLIVWAVPRSLLVRVIGLVDPPLELGLLIYLYYPVIGLLVYYLLRDGHRGANRYGADPKEAVASP
jgi:uncharacterized membrane protein YhaH (DUF805 family)